MNKFCWLILLVFIMGVTDAQAVTYYVDQLILSGCTSAYNPTTRICGTGTDRSYVTIAAALAGIGSASGVGANSIVDVRAGTYNENIDTTSFPTGTSWTSPFTLRAHAGETVTWRSSGEQNLRIIQSGSMYSIVQGFVFDGQNLSTTVGQIVLGNEQSTGANFFRLDGNTIINTHITAIYISHTVNNSEIVNNTIHSGEFYCLVTACGGGGAYAYGIYHNGSNDLIERNEFYDFPSYAIHIYSGWGSPSNNIVRYNKIHDFGSFYAGTGASPAGGDPGSAAILAYHSGGTGNQIYGNSIWRGTSCIAMNMDGGAVYNNTCYNMTGTAGGLGGIGFLDDTYVRNNIISSISGGAVLVNFSANPIPVTVTTNFCPSPTTGCSRTGDPLFISPSTGNFALQTSPTPSTAIDAGAANISPGIIIPACSGGITILCYNGTAPDMGAVESGVPSVGGTPPTVRPNPPVGITIGMAISATAENDAGTRRTANTGDYVGLYVPGASANTFIDWFYMNGTKTAPTVAINDALILFTAPSAVGGYEFRFYQNGSTSETDRLATAAFTVGPNGLVFKYNGSSVTKMAGTSQTVKVGVP